jgi:hypothetical protein
MQALTEAVRTQTLQGMFEFPQLRAMLSHCCRRWFGAQRRGVTRAVRQRRQSSTQRRRSHARVLAAALLASGCVSQARPAMRTDSALLTHESQEPIAGVAVEQLDALLKTLARPKSILGPKLPLAGASRAVSYEEIAPIDGSTSTTTS